MYEADSTAGDPMKGHKALRKSLSCMSISSLECEITKSSVEQWPPVWTKSIEECPEYYYLSDYLPGGCCWSKSPDPKTQLFYKQVEETRGYDVTAEFNGYNPYLPDPDPLMVEDYDQWCRVAVEHINNQAKLHGELYEFDRLVKILPRGEISHFTTFKVKMIKSGGQDLIEVYPKTVQAFIMGYRDYTSIESWRFKPDEE